MKKIKWLKNYKIRKIGEISNSSNNSAKNFVEQGYAEYVDENTKNRKNNTTSTPKNQTDTLKSTKNHEIKKNPLEKNEKSGNLGNLSQSLDDKQESQMKNMGKSAGNLGNPIIPNSPKDSQSSQHSQIKYLKQNKDIILYELQNKQTIKALSDKIKLNTKEIRNIIDRDSNQCLIKLGFVESDEEYPKQYIITQKGKEYLKDLEIEYNNKIEEENQRKQAEDYQTNKLQSWISFFENQGKKELYESINSGLTFIEYDFIKIAKYLPDMADELLDNFDEEYNIVNNAIKTVLIDEKIQCEVKFNNLPKSEKISIGELRKNHINKLVSIPSTVISFTQTRTMTTFVRCECVYCGDIISIMQTSKKIRLPKKCKCGGKGFRVLHKETIDIQTLKLEELPELLEKRTQQDTITAIIKNGLCDIKFQHNYQESKPILFNAIVRQEPVKEGSVENIIFLEVHSIEFDKSQKDINISEHDILKFKEYSKKHNVANELVKIVSPEIVNREKEKLGLILSLVSGGLPKTKKRDDCHVLLVGDPSLGKSTMIYSIFDLYPLSRWVSGKGTTGVGLVGSVIKDEQTGQVMLSKGALALANNNVIICDELDKMGKEDRNSLHEPMEKQFTSINKFNKHLTVQTDTTLICAANPKHGYFSRNDDIYRQIDLPSTLKTRFDLIFCMIDCVDEKNDKLTAEAILDSFDKKELNSEKINFLRKYIYYIRKNIKPEISEETKKIFKKYYVDMRNKSKEDNKTYITGRQLEGMARLAKANAKLHFRNETNKKDAEIAIKLMKYSFQTMGIEDLNVIESGLTTEEIDKVTIFDNLYDSLSKEDNLVLIQDLIQLGKPAIDDTLIKKLKEKGDYFEPKPGYIQKT